MPGHLRPLGSRQVGLGGSFGAPRRIHGTATKYKTMVATTNTSATSNRPKRLLIVHPIASSATTIADTIARCLFVIPTRAPAKSRCAQCDAIRSRRRCPQIDGVEEINRTRLLSLYATMRQPATFSS
jgi:hypothetical protein